MQKQFCGGAGQNDRGLFKLEDIIFWGPWITNPNPKGFMGISRIFDDLKKFEKLAHGWG